LALDLDSWGLDLPVVFHVVKAGSYERCRTRNADVRNDRFGKRDSPAHEAADRRLLSAVEASLKHKIQIQMRRLEIGVCQLCHDVARAGNYYSHADPEIH
jgi:hypothetical protein